MPKTRTALPPLALAPALLLLAVASARAQAPADATPTPRDAAAYPQATPSPTPLTAGQKIERSFHSAFLTPTPYLTNAFSAAITQWRERRPPHKTGGDELADWGSRTARDFATGSVSTLFAQGFYPALFRQDPRYERSRQKGFARRTIHAASRVFVTRGDGGSLQPNYSLLAGEMTASTLANAWERNTPGFTRIGTGATFRLFGNLLASDMLTNVVFKEFGPDIKRLFKH